MFVPAERHELGGTEEHILRRGFGYCNEMARVLTAMAQIAGLPSRLLFVRQPDGGRHVMTEILVDRKWGFFDPSFNICLPAGKAYADAWDVRRSKRLRGRLDRVAEDNEKYKMTLGRRGALYSNYFDSFWLVNYPLTDFPYGVVYPRGSRVDSSSRTRV
jgi:transglutaminase-like putative cysteine protease